MQLEEALRPLQAEPARLAGHTKGAKLSRKAPPWLWSHDGPRRGWNIDRGGAALVASLRNCGVRMAGNGRSTGVEHNAPDGGFSALLLDDGSAIDGDLPVLSCGVRPRTELAAGCGLSTGAGILVDHKLRAHHEPYIFAIGDCAEVHCPDPEYIECRTVRAGGAGLAAG